MNLEFVSPYLLQILNGSLQVIIALSIPSRPLQSGVGLLAFRHSLAVVVDNVSMVDREEVRGRAGVIKLVVQEQELVVDLSSDHRLVS